MSSRGLCYWALDMPLQEETIFSTFLFLRSVFTVCHSENKPFDLLYKHNSISHTSVYVCVCVCPCVSLHLCLLFKAPLFPVKKRGTRLWTI